MFGASAALSEIRAFGPQVGQAHRLFLISTRKRFLTSPGAVVADGARRIQGAEATLEEQTIKHLAFVWNYSIWEDLRIIARTLRRTPRRGSPTLGRSEETRRLRRANSSLTATRLERIQIRR
jgi:hypothetical protein